MKIAVCPAYGWVAFLGSVSPWELPISRSVISQQMSDSTLFPALPSSIRVWSVWTGRESQRSSVGQDFHLYQTESSTASVVRFGWKVYLRTVTVIHFQRIALVTPLEWVRFRHGDRSERTRFPTLPSAAPVLATQPSRIPRYL